jgi:DNA-binding transcriptional LysR family regulator
MTSSTISFRRGQLRCFVTVAEEGQITRAAARLRMAQPAVSQAVALLEAEIGLQLLRRHPRGITLTPAGEAFLVKARAAVAAEADAAESVRALGRSTEGTIEFGFVGTPPGLDSPRVLEAFTRAHPAIDIRYRELPFPSTPTSAWLSEVDVAVCHLPPADPDVWVHTLRSEARIALAPSRHPLSERSELGLAEALGETFIGFHPSVEPRWAGFWSLDDHRGAPPRDVTPDGARNPHEVLASLAVRNALTIVPAAVAGLIPSLISGVSAIALPEAQPATIALLGREDRRNPLVDALLDHTQGVRRDDAPAASASGGSSPASNGSHAR